MSITVSNISQTMKITAATAIETRGSFVKTRIATGIKTDGSTKETLVSWMLTTTYRNGKAVNFSIHFQEWQGKARGFFTEVARLVPCQKTGMTLEIYRSSRLSSEDIKIAVGLFLELETVKLEVNRGNLPRQFYVLSAVFHQCKVTHGEDEDIEAPVKLALLDQDVWKTVVSTLPAIFPQFYGLNSAGIPLTPIKASEAPIDVESTDVPAGESLMSKAELIQFAQDLSVTVDANATRADLIAAIAAATA